LIGGWILGFVGGLFSFLTRGVSVFDWLTVDGFPRKRRISLELAPTDAAGVGAQHISWRFSQPCGCCPRQQCMVRFSLVPGGSSGVFLVPAFIFFGVSRVSSRLSSCCACFLSQRRGHRGRGQGRGGGGLIFLRKECISGDVVHSDFDRE